MRPESSLCLFPSPLSLTLSRHRPLIPLSVTCISHTPWPSHRPLYLSFPSVAALAKVVTAPLTTAPTLAAAAARCLANAATVLSANLAVSHYHTQAAGVGEGAAGQVCDSQAGLRAHTHAGAAGADQPHAVGSLAAAREGEAAEAETEVREFRAAATETEGAGCASLAALMSEYNLVKGLLRAVSALKTWRAHAGVDHAQQKRGGMEGGREGDRGAKGREAGQVREGMGAEDCLTADLSEKISINATRLLGGWERCEV